MRLRHLGQKGFTFPELVVVAVVAVVALIIVSSLLRPANYENDLHNAVRRTDLAVVAQALQKYKVETGAFPADIPTELKTMGSGASQYNICALLVPRYMEDLPRDPETGIKFYDSEETSKPCTGKDVEYSSGYTIVRSSDGVVTLSAPSAQGEAIELRIR